jgi:hypothetical protein
MDRFSSTNQGWRRFLGGFPVFDVVGKDAAFLVFIPEETNRQVAQQP